MYEESSPSSTSKGRSDKEDENPQHGPFSQTIRHRQRKNSQNQVKETRNPQQRAARCSSSLKTADDQLRLLHDDDGRRK